MALQGFDKDFYLSAKLAALQADPATATEWAGKDTAFLEDKLVNGFGLTAEQHYTMYGYQEGLAPNAFFDPAEYIAAKATAMFNDPSTSYTSIKEAADAFVATWNEIGGGNVYDHYLQYGAAENVNPSNSFDNSAYLEAKLAELQAAGTPGFDTVADVEAAFAAAGLTALGHFIEYGQAEGLTAPAVPEDEQVSPDVDPGVPGETFTLTTAPDNVVGTANDDTINGYLNTTATATSTTLSAADVIDGAAGVDSLNLTVEGNVAPALPNAAISNVEKFIIRDVAAAASDYDFSAINGETEVWANTATNTFGIDFSNLGTDTTVGIKGNNVLTNLGNVSFNMATATDAVSIAIDGGVKNGVAPTITNTTAGAATAATISSTGAANTVGAITLAAAAGNSVKTLTVNAETDLTATLTAADFAADAKLVVTGEGKVNLGANFDGDTIDAAGNSGGLTISTTTGVTKAVTGSSAADTVTLVGSLTSTGNVSLGEGNDKLLAGAGASIAGTNVFDGGAGSDSISASLINAANAAAIQNFELLDISAATVTPLDVELVTGSTITGLTLSGDAAGAATLNNVAAGVGLTIDGANTGAKTINLKDAATNAADSFAITFDGAKANTAPATPNVTAVTGGITLDNVETVSIASGGADNTWNGILLNGSANNTLQTLTITGDKNLNIDLSAAAFGKAPTAATDTVNGLKLIDGSAATGKLDIDLTNAATLNTSVDGLTVKGGSADDTITLANSVLVAGTNSQKFTVDAGAGNDTITLAANGGTLTGGAGNDTFDVTAAVATGTTEATAVLTTIVDLTAGDKIDFAGGANTFQSTQVTLGAGVNNLDQAMAASIDAANEVVWFQYGSNTYVVADNNGDNAFSAGDTVVEITGQVDLSSSTLAGTVLTIA